MIWRLVRLAHRADFTWFLPAIARLPLPLAYALSGLRGRTNAIMGRDWRSVALGFRHIRRQSLSAYALLPGSSADHANWCRQRFETEARDELEAQLVAKKRLAELSCRFVPTGAEQLLAKRTRGLVLLTPHFDSFYLGIAFLAQTSGARINSMSSAVSKDPRVEPAVSLHFENKYRGLEHYLHGGKVPDMEVGLRPFYRMLERQEVLVVLGDAPVLPNGVSMKVDFLGAQRMIAGGALRLAEHTDSDLGGYVCRYLGAGRYELEMCPIGRARDPETVARVYRFLSQQILAQPGLWWAADMLPNMPPSSDDPGT
jgi:lauroyl/myristoyl acyltransferase